MLRTADRLFGTEAETTDIPAAGELWVEGRLLTQLRIDLGDSFAAVRRLRPLTLVAALALSLLAYAGRSYRWSVLLRQSGADIPVATAYRLTLTGIFYGMVTPGRVGELARVLDAMVGRLRDDARHLADAWERPEGQEGITAFLEKRPPAWRA